MMDIPDFNDSEQQLVGRILRERYSRPVDFQSADVELQLDPATARLTSCPALYWNELGAEFIVCKIAGQRYRCQFFYSANEQFGTGRDVYDDLGDCVSTLLRLQADHGRIRSAAMADAAGKRTAPADDEYHGPLVV